jgi:hypothetical protein
LRWDAAKSTERSLRTFVGLEESRNGEESDDGVVGESSSDEDDSGSVGGNSATGVNT